MSNPDSVAPVPIKLDKSHSDNKPGGLISLVVSLAPLIVIILATKPGLRQAIKLRATHSLFVFCDRQSEVWKNATMATAKLYRNAQL